MLNRFFTLLLTFLLTLTVPYGLAEEDASDKTPGLTLWQLTNQSHSQMMSYLFKTNTGQLVVLDGGTAKDADYLLSMIKSIRPDGQVAAWLISHAHGDHYGALAALLERHADEFTIGTLYYSFPDNATLDRIEPSSMKSRARHLSSITNEPHKNIGKVVHPEQGEAFTVDTVTFTAMNSLCPDFDGYTHGVNDSSIVWRVETKATSLLFLGDLGERGCNWLFEKNSPERLRTDYTQLSHHGQWSLTFEQYEVLQPKRCLWPATDWLWNNDAGKGPGTGPYELAKTNQWMSKLGASEHYNAKDGTITLELP
ncbi:MAG: MBL fold metallo-hydrolase [Planctomycetia bacterium]|nr:MBL fold metallo-hydrolase [Planctomycetia bacterium]